MVTRGYVHGTVVHRIQTNRTIRHRYRFLYALTRILSPYERNGKDIVDLRKRTGLKPRVFQALLDRPTFVGVHDKHVT